MDLSNKLNPNYYSNAVTVRLINLPEELYGVPKANFIMEWNIAPAQAANSVLYDNLKQEGTSSQVPGCTSSGGLTQDFLQFSYQEIYWNVICKKAF